jgi:hypothetical protein
MIKKGGESGRVLVSGVPGWIRMERKVSGGSTWWMINRPLAVDAGR